MKLLRCLATLVAAVLVSTASRAQPVDIPIPDIPYTRFMLDNGLTLIVHEDHKLPMVAVNTWYHVGSKNEKPGKTGFAHLFEHLMFSGSENFNRNYLKELGGIGATDLNGTTNVDRTNYFQNVPTSMLDYALFVESDRMGHLLGVLDQKKLDLQRGVVQNEKRQRENAPYGGVDQLVVENTYPAGHPYSWTVIGSMKDLDAASMADVREWFQTYYGPGNVTLVLAGDITPEVALRKVVQYYGDIPPGPPLGRHQAWIAKGTGTHRGVLEDRVPQARLFRVWNTPGRDTPAQPLLDLAARVLGGGKTSRLYKRLVVKDQVATTAQASADMEELGGQFNFDLTARPGEGVAALERAADEELQAMLRSGPTAAELQLAKTAILARFARLAERIGGFGGKSDLLAACATYTGKPDCYKDYLRGVKDATPATVQAAMQQWLADGDYVLEVRPYAGGTVAKGADRSAGPPRGQAEALRLPAMRRATLGNGLQVVLAEVHTAPVVNLSLLVDGGYASDPMQQPGLTGLTLRMLQEGTASRSAERVSEDVAALGARLDARANLDGMFVNLSALKATLAPALEIYADVILHPAFPASEFERVRKQQLATIQAEKAEAQDMASRVLPGLLFGPRHAYSRPMTGTGSEPSVQRMTRDDLVHHHRTWFRPNNATLVVVGDTTLAEVVPLLEKAFSGWAAGEVPRKDISPAQPPAKTAVYLLDRPGSQQSLIVGAQLLPPLPPADLVQLQVVNDIFGGTFSSRINMNLREDKHWSYGVWSEVLPSAVQRVLVSRSPVQSDKTSEALAELAAEYHGIAGARAIATGELRAAQDRQALGLPGRFETANALSDAYTRLLQFKLPPDFYNSFTGQVMALTLRQANAMAHRAVDPDRLVWLVIGDMGKVEAGIRELKLGEVRRIDIDGKEVNP